MSDTVIATKPPTSYPFKGIADTSWPTCPNCQGFGHITQELAIARAVGIKGDPCGVCNGAGRVPDPAWPGCPEGADPDCPLCYGLGTLSPARQAAIAQGQLQVPCGACAGTGAVAYQPRKGATPRRRAVEA